jgi:hypothetical protein
MTGLTAYHAGTNSRPINDAAADATQTADGPREQVRQQDVRPIASVDELAC